MLVGRLAAGVPKVRIFWNDSARFWRRPTGYDKWSWPCYFLFDTEMSRQFPKRNSFCLVRLTSCKWCNYPCLRTLGDTEQESRVGFSGIWHGRGDRDIEYSVDTPSVCVLLEVVSCVTSTTPIWLRGRQISRGFLSCSIKKSSRNYAFKFCYEKSTGRAHRFFLALLRQPSTKYGLFYALSV